MPYLFLHGLTLVITSPDTVRLHFTMEFSNGLKPTRLKPWRKETHSRYGRVFRFHRGCLTYSSVTCHGVWAERNWLKRSRPLSVCELRQANSFSASAKNPNKLYFWGTIIHVYSLIHTCRITAHVIIVGKGSVEVQRASARPSFPTANRAGNKYLV